MRSEDDLQRVIDEALSRRTTEHAIDAAVAEMTDREFADLCQRTRPPELLTPNPRTPR